MTSVRQFDFHLHTRASDGVYPPQKVLELAAQAGLDGVSITDHDTLDAYDQLTALESPRLLPGVELSTRLDDEEAHILGYFPAGIDVATRAYIERVLSERRERMALGIVKLRERGLDISWQDCEEQATGRVVSRRHLAMALVEKRYIGRAHRAYPDYAGPTVVPLPNELAVQAIRRLRALGAVTIWAHPGVRQIDQHLGTLRDAGLEGLEVHIPRRSRGERRTLAERAQALGLLVTGGSDWHGHAEGKELGRFRVSEDSVGELLARIGW